MPEVSLIDSSAEIENPLHPRNTLYPIEEILLLSMCGADDLVSIAEFGDIEARLAPRATSVRTRSAVASAFLRLSGQQNKHYLRDPLIRKVQTWQHVNPTPRSLTRVGALGRRARQPQRRRSRAQHSHQHDQALERSA